MRAECFDAEDVDIVISCLNALLLSGLEGEEAWDVVDELIDQGDVNSVAQAAISTAAATLQAFTEGPGMARHILTLMRENNMEQGD